MKIQSLVFIALIIAGTFGLASAQHSLQLDDGASPRHLSLIQGQTVDPFDIFKLPGNGGGTILVDNGSGVSSAWLVTGNKTTTAGTNFLGTTDNQPFEIHLFNTDAANKGSKRVMRYEPNAASPNIIGGYQGNAVTTGAFSPVGAFIGSGGENAVINQIVSVNSPADFNVIVGGFNNSITDASFSAVLSGSSNEVQSGFSGVANSVVSGGQSNDVYYSSYSNIAGGFSNAITGTVAVNGSGNAINGGSNNSILNAGSNVFNGNVIGGGANNTINANTASASMSTISGGNGNSIANVSNATIGGGLNNTANGIQSFVGGGQNNSASTNNTTIGGGVNNIANAMGSTVGGGGYDGATVAGNTASGVASGVLGGLGNTASGTYATVGGGASNQATGNGSVVAGGGRTAVPTTAGNTASGTSAFVGGGYGAVASGDYSTALGGEAPHATGGSSFVAGGYGNTAGAYATSVIGGRGLTLSGQFSWGYHAAVANADAISLTKTNVGVLGNIDLWLVNEDNTAHELRFWAPNATAGAFPPGTAKYVGFKPGAVTTSVTWTLPLADATANGAALISNSAGALSWTAGPAVSTSAAGTANTIPKFTGASQLANSLLTDNGTNLQYSGTGTVMIGTQAADPAAATADTRLRLLSMNGNSDTWDYGVVSNGDQGYVESNYDNYGIWLDADNNIAPASETFTINRGANHTAGTQVFKVSGNGFVNATGVYQLSGTTVLANNFANNVLSLGPGAATSGTNNTFLGNQAANATTGDANTVVGQGAWLVGGAGNDNTFLGSIAGYSSSGSLNTAVGYESGRNNTGAQNTYVGYRAGYTFPLNAAGNSNVYLGGNAGDANTTGSNNTFLGQNANANAANLSNATAIGQNSLVTGSNTIQLGNTSVTLVNTSGAYNTAVGYEIAAAAATGTFLYGNGTNYVASTLTVPNSATTGDILYATGSNAIGNLADVATGQVLTSGGAGAAPSYSSTPTLGKVSTTTGTLTLDNAASAFSLTIQSAAIATASRTYTIPDAGAAGDQFAITSAAPVDQTVPVYTGTAGLIKNSSITDNGTTVSTSENLATTGTGAITAANGLTVTAGGATVTAGGLTVTAGVTKLSYAQVAAGATITIPTTSSVIEITDDAANLANLITMPTVTTANNGRILYIYNGDSQKTTGTAINSGATATFIVAAGAWQRVGP